MPMYCMSPVIDVWQGGGSPTIDSNMEMVKCLTLNTYRCLVYSSKQFTSFVLFGFKTENLQAPHLPCSYKPQEIRWCSRRKTLNNHPWTRKTSMIKAVQNDEKFDDRKACCLEAFHREISHDFWLPRARRWSLYDCSTTIGSGMYLQLVVEHHGCLITWLAAVCLRLSCSSESWKSSDQIGG